MHDDVELDTMLNVSNLAFIFHCFSRTQLMQDIELGKKIDELFQARWVVNGWGVNGDGCTDLLLLFCCLLIRPAVLELIRTWWRIGF